MLDISIIIPFKNHAGVTLECLRSLHTFGEQVKEILLISNNSSQDEIQKVKDQLHRYPNTTLLIYNHPFNYHKINNFGVQHASGSVVMFLNNDIELIKESSGLLSYMHEKAMAPKTGAVGCVLLYEDGKTIQHGGVYLVPGGTADHLYARQKLSAIKRKIKDGQVPYDISEDLKVSAVTAAAVMIERKKLDEIGGMNENFVIGGGDVDMCLRLEDAGYSNWLCGFSHGFILHKESMSRSNITIPYVDFCESYKIYIKHFDTTVGDKYLNWDEVRKI